ncbi:MAG TPA: DNA recombination protein RmuC [Thermoanaerobaculia bacterium]|nr:DNA recombination protein RmuC [Thermoanaerobaculia bacterium]
MMEILLAAAVGAALVLGAVALLRRPREADPRLDRVLTEIAAVRGSSESVDRRVDELRRSVGERVSAVETRLVEGQKDVADTLGQVHEKMGRVFQASQKIQELAGGMTRLEDLLKPPKVRGGLGETFLEKALADVLPPGSWKMRHVFPDGTIVDAAIRVGDFLVPVDSKFPLENYRRSKEAPDESDRKRARRDFAGDVKRHVEAIATKYIRPGDGTYDFAFMYVPSEAVYCEIVFDEEGVSLADWAAEERRVIAVSPRLLHVYLATVCTGLRGMAVEERAKEILEHLSDLHREWSLVEDPFRTLGSHLRNSQKQYDAASRAFDRFGGKLDTIAEQGESDAVEGIPALTVLPRPS